MQAAGHKWQIEVHPGGYSKSSDTEAEVQRYKEHVVIFIKYMGDSEALRTKYLITLVNQLPGKADKTRGDGVDGDVINTFGQVNSGIIVKGNGFPAFIKRSVLKDESNGWKVDDRVIIRATITTFGGLESTVLRRWQQQLGLGLGTPRTWHGVGGQLE